MNIEGTYTIQAPLEVVRNYLRTNPDLKQIIPGLVHLERRDELNYDLILNMEHAPLQGRYEGSYILLERIPSAFYRFEFESKGQQGAFGGTGQIHLQEHQDSTIVSYKGTLILSAATAHFHPTLVKGAIKLMIQQSFTALAASIHAHQAAKISAHTPVEHPGSSQVGGTIVVLPSQNEEARPAATDLFTHGVRMLHLGDGNPQQEIIWAQRLRTVSYLSGVLLLVWLGTRFSRRRHHD